ncbi:F-box/FBD/LRR-repeat protein At4g26340-like [Cornus florida]|uniref:F-box/FBD/LRR-repeat protein At4g26340-like n=1 Tax=Cornus florida TaxID=4283 RepID=UPI00289FCFBB|nr:F-box/FBD/LRR-repeat protein At4g26340-like [Cornus florida]
MAKAAQLTSNFVLQKCNTSSIYLEDRISRLSDDILVIILSRLTMREAARTSVLSSRWKNLWIYMTGSLDFDASKVLWEVQKRVCGKFLKDERSKYVSWVNRVLSSHKGTTIEEFRVSFDLDIYYGIYIDAWINFAIKKRVQRLELNLKRLYYSQRQGRYFFPSNSHVLSSLKNLTSLRLNCLDVSGEVLEYLLSNCPFLQELHVVDSTRVVKLKVSGPSLKLKSLVMVNCYNLECIEISSVNLVSFKYQGGSSTRILLENVPHLTDVSYGGCYSDYIIKKFRQFPSYMFQLEKLSLHLSDEVLYIFPKFPKLRNLRQLELTVEAYDKWSLLPCIFLLNASPFLYRFSLAFLSRSGPSIGRNTVGNSKKHTLKCIKIVELVAFAGRKPDVEFAEYILEKAISLEKMIIDTRYLYSVGTPSENVEDEKRLAAKKCAEQLHTKRRPGVDLVIL